MEPVFLGSEANKAEQTISDMVSEPSNPKRTDAFQIFVRTWYGKTTSLEVEPSDTIRNVKAKILEREGMPPHRYNFIFDGSKLKDHLKICDANIKNQSTIRTVARRRDRNGKSVGVQNCIPFADYCRLYSRTGVCMPGGWLFDIDTKNTTIGELKLRIVHSSRVPRDEILLMLGKEVISNDDQLVADAMEGKHPQEFCLYSTKCDVDYDVVAMPPPPTSSHAHDMKTKRTKRIKSNNLLKKVLMKSAGQIHQTDTN